MATIFSFPDVLRTPAPRHSGRPLCVDLDGTLIRTDLLWESLVDVLTRRPWMVVMLPFWLLKGRARLKYELGRRAQIAVNLLPYNAEVIALLQREKHKGRELLLVTAADRNLAEAVAANLGLFDEVLASGPNLNLKGEAKARLLTELYGDRGFDYAGDSWADLAVWSHCERALVVSCDVSLVGGVDKVAGSCEQVVLARPHPLRATMQAMRVYQWLKNCLVFVPVLVGHRWTDSGRWLDAGLAFASFSLVASAVYVINDLFDLAQDRAHPDKRHRPFASGQLPLSVGLALPLVLLTSAFGIASMLAGSYSIWLAGYFAATCAYTFTLKHKLMADVVWLAMLYTLRILAGGAATNVVISPWLLGLSVFLFLSLAFVKRVSELTRTGKDTRAYKVADMHLLSMMGIASGYLAALVLALYINSPDVSKIYSTPQLLWPICLVLVYWVSRVWVLTVRGALPHDPILFALRDKASYACLATAAALIVVARFWR